jgi:hypothetical protein
MVSKKEILEKIKQDMALIQKIKQDTAQLEKIEQEMKRLGLDKQAANIRPARKVRNFK